LLLPLVLTLIFAGGCGGGGSTQTRVIITEKTRNYDSEPTAKNIEKSNFHLAKAKKFYSRGKYKQVKKHCEKAIAYNPQNWEAYYYLGLAMQKRREYAESIKTLEVGLVLSPNNKYVRSDIHCTLGINWENLGRPEKARNEYNQALAFNSGNSIARKGLNRIKVKKTLRNWDKKREIEHEG
jgi:tetratricopeptide (TPR) repeat protein